MMDPSTETVRRALASIEQGRTDAERARRTELLKKLPARTRVATILEAAEGSAELRRAAALAISRVGGTGAAEALATRLVDPDYRTRDYAAQAMALYPEIARDSVPALGRLVKLELPRTRQIGALRPALEALGAAGTAPALKVLLAVSPRAFKVTGFRADWVAALARYRSPQVRRALVPFLESRLVRERAAALIGLLRNGRESALSELRAALDDDDFFDAREVARQAHHALGTKMVFNPKQLETLKKWWDKPNDLAKRAKNLQNVRA